MKVKEFVGMQMMFAENPLKFDIAMSDSFADECAALTVDRYYELGELVVDNWEVVDGRMRLYCSADSEGCANEG